MIVAFFCTLCPNPTGEREGERERERVKYVLALFGFRSLCWYHTLHSPPEMGRESENDDCWPMFTMGDDGLSIHFDSGVCEVTRV